MYLSRAAAIPPLRDMGKGWPQELGGAFLPSPETWSLPLVGQWPGSACPPPPLTLGVAGERECECVCFLLEEVSGCLIRGVLWGLHRAASTQQTLCRPCNPLVASSARSRPWPVRTLLCWPTGSWGRRGFPSLPMGPEVLEGHRPGNSPPSWVWWCPQSCPCSV